MCFIMRLDLRETRVEVLSIFSFLAEPFYLLKAGSHLGLHLVAASTVVFSPKCDVVIVC